MFRDHFLPSLSPPSFLPHLLLPSDNSLGVEVVDTDHYSSCPLREKCEFSVHHAAERENVAPQPLAVL
jgi:hypothetical protein